jgi:hypothetical protein
LSGWLIRYYKRHTELSLLLIVIIIVLIHLLKLESVGQSRQLDVSSWILVKTALHAIDILSQPATVLCPAIYDLAQELPHIIALLRELLQLLP